MARLQDLLRQASKLDPQLGADLAKEFKELNSRRTFGLVFEPHMPEAVELPDHPLRRGLKVRVLSPRGDLSSPDKRIWYIESLGESPQGKIANLTELNAEDPEQLSVPADDLVVVAEFRDTIYPGLVETGRVERGGDKPYHTVINAENYHALEMLTYTHRHAIDAIYIDPPYNTGAKDWKYNNDYVGDDDDYRHSKWLAMMERRLRVARELLNPDDSVLIVTIDEKEYLRLGLLLEQTFPEARIQMVSIAISPSGIRRSNAFRRSDEYIYFAKLGDSRPVPSMVSWDDSIRKTQKPIRWNGLMRSGTNSRRLDRPGLFYPVYISTHSERIVGIGNPLQSDGNREDHIAPQDTVAVWPIRSDGTEGNWQVGPETLRKLVSAGYVRTGVYDREHTSLAYLKSGERSKVENGVFGEVTTNDKGWIEVERHSDPSPWLPSTQWNTTAHSAADHGSTLLRTLLPNRRFPFPKSLYATEDALRFFVANKPNAIILDYFSGSGTTTHAVMRLNKQDGGSRQCISVTNNEVSDEEQTSLRMRGLRPGDEEWEALGICDYITKPRITAAITGITPEGQPIKGDYKFTDEFPMADGFEENAAYFTLTYESLYSVRHHRSFEKIGPMLWLRAGAQGRIITDLGDRGWDISQHYAVIENIDDSEAFLEAVAEVEDLRLLYVITDNDSAFQMVIQDLPESVTTVQLYESYLQNFQINTGRSL